MIENILYTSKSNFDERVAPYLEEISVEEPIINGKEKHYFLLNNQKIEAEIAEDLSVKITLEFLTINTLNELKMLNCKSLEEK